MKLSQNRLALTVYLPYRKNLFNIYSYIYLFTSPTEFGTTLLYALPLILNAIAVCPNSVKVTTYSLALFTKGRGGGT